MKLAKHQLSHENKTTYIPTEITNTDFIPNKESGNKITTVIKNIDFTVYGEYKVTRNAVCDDLLQINLFPSVKLTG